MTAIEQKELKNIEATIHTAEEHVEQCRHALDDPQAASDPVETQKRWDALEAARRRVDTLYARWEKLEAKAN